MSRIELVLIIWAIAARPFLPAGRGGLILIAGGLSMTTFAMLLLMARGRPAGMDAGPHGAGGGDGTVIMQRSTRVVQRPAQLARAVQVDHDRLVWPDYVRSAAAKTGLHNTVLLSVDRTRCTLEVRHCRSCRRGRRGCDHERKRLLRAARKLSRRARVRELSCNQDGRHVCTFHIDMGARR